MRRLDILLKFGEKRNWENWDAEIFFIFPTTPSFKLASQPLLNFEWFWWRLWYHGTTDKTLSWNKGNESSECTPPSDNNVTVLLEHFHGRKTQLSGTHWVCWFKRGNEKFYFDSFGLPPPTELNNYLGGDVFYPTEQIQPRQEVFCGHLCLFVLKEMQKGKQLQEIINNFWWYNKCQLINSDEVQRQQVKM